MSSYERDAFINGKAIFPDNPSFGGDDPYSLLDEQWVKTSFLISDSELANPLDIANRYWSTASAKFTDGRIGGNFGINNHPQYTPYADFPVPGRLEGRRELSLSDSSGNWGWGEYFSSAVDDTKQTIYIRAGVPQFNSLLNYFTNAFDPNNMTLARTGRMPSAVYDAAKLVGTFFAVRANPAIAITVLAGRVLSTFFNRSTSKFYTMRPTMYLYWSTVNMLANTLAVNLGIFPKIMNMNSDNTQRLNKPFAIDQDYLDAISNVIPDVFGDQNYFDIHSIANRAQRLANQIHSQEMDRFDASTPTDFVGYLNREGTGNGTHSNKVMQANGKHRLEALIDETLKLTRMFKSEPTDSTVTATDPRIDPENAKQDKPPGWIQEYAAYFDAEFRMGSQFAMFNVDYTGPMTTSFSNQTGPSELANKLNSTSSTVREARFSMMEGNIVGGVVQDVQEIAMDAAMGFLNGITYDGVSFLKGILGDGFVDIPEHWTNSGVSLPETTYTMNLKATYNSPISKMTTLYIPLCMALALVLPRSTGKQSYTSPFLVQIFDKGKAQIRLGMVKSMTITAGSPQNIGFDQYHRPLGFEISFTVVDLSSVMHMPLSSAGFGGNDMTLDEDNILSDYLAVLASQDIYTQIYPMAQARMRAAKLAIARGKWGSPAFWAAATYDSATSGILQKLTLGAGNLLEGAVRGNETAFGNV